MNIEEKVEMICSFYDCDFINRYHSYYFDNFSLEDTLSPERFHYLMDKYGISKKALVNKGVDISNSEHSEDKQSKFDFEIRKQIDKIGDKEKKIKNGKTYSYTRNAGPLPKQALLELFHNSLPIPAPPFVSLQNALTLSRGSTIIQFLKKRKVIGSDILTFGNIETLKESLQKLSESELCELLNLLQSNSSADEEDSNYLDHILDKTPVENSLLLKKILQTTELDAEVLWEICILCECLHEHPELNMDKLQYALSKRRRNKSIPNSADKVSQIQFPDSVNDIDEYTLKYHDIPELMNRFTNYFDSDILYYNFSYMNKTMWDIIRFTLRSFIDPLSKNVSNFFEKFGL